MKRENVVFAFWAGVVLWLAGVPVFLIGMSGELGSWAAVFEMLGAAGLWQWLAFVLLTPVMGFAALMLPVLVWGAFTRRGTGYGGN